MPQWKRCEWHDENREGRGGQDECPHSQPSFREEPRPGEREERAQDDRAQYCHVNIDGPDPRIRVEVVVRAHIVVEKRPVVGEGCERRYGRNGRDQDSGVEKTCEEGDGCHEQQIRVPLLFPARIVEEEDSSKADPEDCGQLAREDTDRRERKNETVVHSVAWLPKPGKSQDERRVPEGVLVHVPRETQRHEIQTGNENDQQASPPVPSQPMAGEVVHPEDEQNEEERGGRLGQEEKGGGAEG